MDYEERHAENQKVKLPELSQPILLSSSIQWVKAVEILCFKTGRTTIPVEKLVGIKFKMAIFILVHCCGVGGSIRACHAADQGSIPCQDRFPG